MAPAQSRPSSDAAELKCERNQRINAALARGNALKKAKEQKEQTYTKDTLLLEDGSCTITLGSLMESEQLDFAKAVQVMHQFRAEASPAAKVPEHPKQPAELPKPAAKGGLKIAPTKPLSPQTSPAESVETQATG